MMCKPGAAGRWNCMDSDLGEGDRQEVRVQEKRSILRAWERAMAVACTNSGCCPRSEVPQQSKLPTLSTKCC
ncbi:hypothetical protein RRG08_061972 [Elysia crispata]|uniref:Uncharacterized protein n=1 Tax=Elysia crispata TaxID=231223 RepID=A0AAE0Z1Z3_9GAST|nr:hypothetical protein RRG08_061972 [Elysia crispata]